MVFRFEESKHSGSERIDVVCLLSPIEGEAGTNKSIHTFPNKFGVIYCIPLAMLGLWLRYLYVFKRKTSFFIRNCEQYPNIDIMAVNAYSKKKKVDRLSK